MKIPTPFLTRARHVIQLVGMAGCSLALSSPLAFAAQASIPSLTQSNSVPGTLTSADWHHLQTSGWNNQVMSHYHTNADVADASAGSLGGLFQQLQEEQFVEARINRNGAALTGEILPQVMDELGYEDFSIANQRLLSGTLPSAVTLALACHNSSAVWQLNMNNIDVRLPLDSRSVEALFTDTGRINTDLDLDDLSIEFELQFYYPDNVGGFYCDTLNMGTTYNFRVNVNVDGASGALDVVADAVGGKPVVNEIKAFELDVDSVTFDSSFLTSLTNLGIGISNLFGSGCSTLTQCVNNALDDELTSNTTFKNQLKDAINDAINYTLSVSGGFNVGAHQVDYVVALDDVVGSNSQDRLASLWAVDFDIDQADDPCADGLRETLFFSGAAATTGNDFEILLPFKKITDLLYVMGKKGVLCENAVVPGTPFGTAEVSVQPAGNIDVNSVAHDVVELVLPMTADVSVTSASGEISADLVIQTRVSPACGAGLELQVTDVAFENVAGVIAWTVFGQTVELDASGFVSGVADDLADDILAALDDAITLLPESFGLQDVARYVSTGDIVSNSNAMAIGLNVENYDPNCN